LQDFGTELVFSPPYESLDSLMADTGLESLLFMDFIKLLDQEPLRSAMPEAARGEVREPTLT